MFHGSGPVHDSLATCRLILKRDTQSLVGSWSTAATTTSVRHCVHVPAYMLAPPHSRNSDASRTACRGYSSISPPLVPSPPCNGCNRFDGFGRFHPRLKPLNSAQLGRVRKSHFGRRQVGRTRTGRTLPGRSADAIAPSTPTCPISPL